MASTPTISAGAIVTRPPVAVPGPTGRRPWSTMLLREWAAVRYPGSLLREQVRLGPTSAALVGVTIDPTLERMLRVENWYADGIIDAPHELVIVEAKVPATPGAISQVLFYQRQALATLELQSSLNKPFVAVVLFAESDDSVNQFARLLGCRVEIYTPSWIADYLTQVQFRRRTATS